MDRTLQWSGVLAVAVTIGSILLATLLSPAFSWQENALSNLGITTTEAGTATTVVLFNGGLVAGGALGLVFCGVLYRAATTPPQRAVVALLSVSLVSMALVGVFPQGTAPHFPVAAGFYTLITLSLWADSLVGFADGRRSRAVRSGVAGTANLGVWLAWVAAGAPWGLAVPEILGALVFGGWLSGRSLTVAR